MSSDGNHAINGKPNSGADSAAGKNSMEQLARRAVAGDEDSFVKLCDAMKTPLFRAAKGILGDDSLALDAVSEAVYRAYKGIRRLRQPEYVATWFTRILINAANDIARSRKHETALYDVPDSTNNNEQPFIEEVHSELAFQQMIASLPPDLRAVISLKYYAGETLEDISHILKIPIGTVKSRLNRALTQLRMEVKQ